MNSLVQERYDLFEDDYLIRTYARIANSPDVALTELIANAWDGGALNVKVTIPFSTDEYLTIEDDGIGMTKDEFLQRWMKLGYNRVKHQGENVIFPEDYETSRRRAYGRNGIGRHSLLCFNNTYYSVETWKNGNGTKFYVGTTKGDKPFEIIKEEEFSRQGHGTRLEVLVNKNLPDADKLLEILAARFMHDPQFKVSINGKLLELSDLKNVVMEEEFYTSNKIKLSLIVLDSSKSSRIVSQHGISFWVGGRRVAEPSWTLDNRIIADGRRKIARRHTVIVQSDDLYNEVLPDWTGFHKSGTMDEVYDLIEKKVIDLRKSIFKEDLEEARISALNENIVELESIRGNRTAKREISNFLTEITEKKPDISQDVLNLAVEAIINVEKSRSASSLLFKLSQMSEKEIDSLDKLLEDWSIVDIISVIDEIDNRIMTIEAIERLCSDKKVDELHVLHPLVTQARWLFGPEYESVSFTFNTSLNRAMKELFDKNVTEHDFVNGRKRPDLILLPDSTTISAVCTEEFDTTSSLNEIDKVLIIELKKGGFEIKRNELQQAQNYVSDILRSGFLSAKSIVHAYVVGDKINDKTDRNIKMGENSEGRVTVTTYSQLIDTASRRLYGLKKVLGTHYGQFETEDIVSKVLRTPRQIKANF